MTTLANLLAWQAFKYPRLSVLAGVLNKMCPNFLRCLLRNNSNNWRA